MSGRMRTRLGGTNGRTARSILVLVPWSPGLSRTFHDAQAAHEFMVCMRCSKVSGPGTPGTGQLRTVGVAGRSPLYPPVRFVRQAPMPQHDGLLDAAVSAQQQREAFAAAM